MFHISNFDRQRQAWKEKQDQAKQGISSRVRTHTVHSCIANAEAANELMQLRLGEDSFQATQNVTANKPTILPS